MRTWLLGLLCIVPMVAGASVPWPGVSWPDVGGGGSTTTIDNYTIGTWYVTDQAWWTLTLFSDYSCIKSRGTVALALCTSYDEVAIPFSSPNGINIVDLTCTLDPDTWTTASEWVELEVRIHTAGDGDEFGASTGITTRLLSDGTAPKIFSSGDTTHTSSITEGYLTLRTVTTANQWTEVNTSGTADKVKAICSVEVN